MTDASPLPRRFGRYELLSLVGRGGMGEVYRALPGLVDNDPIVACEVHALRARTLGALGRSEAARATLAEAQALVEARHLGGGPGQDVVDAARAALAT